MNGSAKIIPMLLAVIFALSGCSSFSKQSRQQRAYEKYIRQSSVARARQQSHFRSASPQMPSQPMPSKPVESTETFPESLSSPEE